MRRDRLLPSPGMRPHRSGFAGVQSSRPVLPRICADLQLDARMGRRVSLFEQGNDEPADQDHGKAADQQRIPQSRFDIFLVVAFAEVLAAAAKVQDVANPLHGTPLFRSPSQYASCEGAATESCGCSTAYFASVLAEAARTLS